MKLIKGKHNEVKVFTDNVENSALVQLQAMADEKIFADSSIRIMPDVHAGKGCTIGTTMTITDKIIPNMVGVDIGCGISCIDLSLKNLDLNLLDEVIREFVPHGMNVHTSKERIDFNMMSLTYCGCALGSIKANIDVERAVQSLGTLGGGNHFIEIGAKQDGEGVLFVHSGSRRLGLEIAKFYTSIAVANQTKRAFSAMTEEKNRIIKELKEQGRESEISVKLKEFQEQVREKEDFAYLEGEDMKNYLHDMQIAQEYANLNREAILLRIREIMQEKSDVKFDTKTYSCIHNYIDLEDGILRKGAISAKEDEFVIIPINMADGVILGRGLGNKDWNQSAPHGAGRILSRGQAHKEIKMSDYKSSMEGVFTTCVGESTIDEAPQAYKPMEEILENIKDTVEVLEVVKPIYNFKSN